MSGNAIHRIESFFIMNFALNRISAVNGKGNRTVAGISVQLSRRALIFFKSLLQRIENDVIEAEWFVDIFFDIRIQLHAGNLFNDQS